MKDTNSEGRLSGTTVVWTGSKNAAGKLLGALEKAGANVERLPLIELGPPEDTERAQLILKNLDDFSWVLFTSVQAARAVEELPPPRARIGAVGPGTAAGLNDQGWPVNLVPSRQDADGLADELEKEGVSSRPVLFVRGDRARRTLPDRLMAAGFRVEEVVVYSTNPLMPELAKEVARRIEEVADVVIAGSPLGVQALATAVAPLSISEIKPGLKWVCLGRATLSALAAAGIADAVYPKKVESMELIREVAAARGVDC